MQPRSKQGLPGDGGPWGRCEDTDVGGAVALVPASEVLRLLRRSVLLFEPNEQLLKSH